MKRRSFFKTLGLALGTALVPVKIIMATKKVDPGLSGTAIKARHTVRFRRYGNLPTRITPLVMGITPRPSSLRYAKVHVSDEEYLRLFTKEYMRLVTDVRL